MGTVAEKREMSPQPGQKFWQKVKNYVDSTSAIPDRLLSLFYLVYEEEGTSGRKSLFNWLSPKVGEYISFITFESSELLPDKVIVRTYPPERLAEINTNSFKTLENPDTPRYLRNQRNTRTFNDKFYLAKSPYGYTLFLSGVLELTPTDMRYLN